jgi:CubicO group peptidase (beta-lactamase class C family)
LTILGSFKYSHAAGKTSAEKHADDIQEDAIFLLASQTKLSTAVSALQLVEQGLIKINDNVEKWLPEFARQPVLRGFDAEDKPILEDRNVPITLW